MYVGFIDLEKAYDRVNKIVWWQVLRMYDVGGKLFSGMLIQACVRVKGGESERFRVDSWERQGCILEDGKEWRLPALL